MRTPRLSLLGSLRRFARDRSGVSAIEFAMIMPLLLTLYIGGVELGDAFTINRKVTRVTSSLGDLVTQSKTLSNNDMDNILDAAASIMAPYDDSLLKIKVTGVETNNRGVSTVAWSDARNDTPYSVGSTIAIPSGLADRNSFLVTAEVRYTYDPIIGRVLTGSIVLSDQFYLRPRISSEITRTTN